MVDIPDGARRPQDHLEPETDAVASEDELLEGMPELIPPTKLRIRQRNKVMTLALKLRAFARGDEEELDLESLTDDDLALFFEVLADIDDFAESIAVDKQAYVAWSEGQDYDVFTALLGRYANTVGKSVRSSN